jgi:DNA-3-methyladenine glycosylase II
VEEIIELSGQMKLILRPSSPYDFDLHLRAFSFNKPQPEMYENGVWKRALRLRSGRIIPLKVRSIGTIEKPRLEVIVLREIDEIEEEELKDRLSWIFNTKTNLEELYNFMNKDPILRQVKQKLYGLRPFNCSTVFEGLIKTIIQQQISLTGSMHITNRLIEKFGEKAKISEEFHYEFPSPEALAKVSLEDLKNCGLSRQKSNYIKEISERIVKDKIDLEELKTLSSQEIIERLMKFKGVGRWTAELTVVTSTGKEALPADDLGARRAVSRFYFKGKLISGERLREFSNKWGEFRSDIAYYLIVAERLKIA